MLDTLFLLQGGGGGGGGGGDGDGDKGELQVTSIAHHILEGLPASPFDKRKAHPATFAQVGNATNSMGVFCGQEMARFNALVMVIRRSLIDLQRAVKGLVVMSSTLEEMFNCFMFQRVPDTWEKAGYPCLKVMTDRFCCARTMPGPGPGPGSRTKRRP